MTFGNDPNDDLIEAIVDIASGDAPFSQEDPEFSTEGAPLWFWVTLAIGVDLLAFFLWNITDDGETLLYAAIGAIIVWFLPASKYTRMNKRRIERLTRQRESLASDIGEVASDVERRSCPNCQVSSPGVAFKPVNLNVSEDKKFAAGVICPSCGQAVVML